MTKIKLYNIITSYNSKIIIIILLSVVTTSTLSQNKIRCAYCKQEVNNKYILVDGIAYHPEHFICMECNKQIIGNFIRKDRGYYHTECFIQVEKLICDYCKKALNEEYIVNENKKYHKSCYENYILTKCAVCSMPLKGEYYEDIYQNKYHPYHKNELHQCDCCNRIICQSLTNGGQDYSDGRHICNKCYVTAVFEQKQLEKLMVKVSERLSSIGITFNLKNIKIVGVDRNVLRNKAKNYNENTQGYCDSKSLSKYIDDKLVNQTTYHTIYVLNGMSSIKIESIIAHELMHSWIYENTKNNFSQKINEGSCNYASYLYLKSLNQNSALEQIKLLESDPDTIYGKGFLEICQRFEYKSVYDFLAFLKH